MRHFLEFAGREDVLRLADTVTEFESVHGVTIEVDPLWMSLWRQSRSGPRAKKDEPEGFPYPWGWRWRPSYDSDYGAIDPSWRPKAWRSAVEADGEVAEDPFLVKVLLLPNVPDDQIDEIDGRLGNIRSSLRVRYEHRPVARAYATPAINGELCGGASIRAESGRRATLGGLVEERTGRRFGVTCGHAVSRDERVAWIDRPGGEATVGRCVASRVLDGPADGLCNRRRATNEVDVALIEIDGPARSELSIGGVGDIHSWVSDQDVCEEAPVEVSAASGHSHLHTGGLFVLGSIFVEEKRFCFRNLIQLKRNSHDYWGVTGTAAPPTSPGDSGGWVIQSGANGPEWCGMVIGGTGPLGLAVFADRVVKWLAEKGFTDIRVR